MFGALGSSALVFGALLGAVWTVPRWLTGIMLAFASGTLIAALAFELFPEAVELGGLAPSAFGLISGSATFVVVNTLIDSRVAGETGEPEDTPLPGALAEELSGAEAGQREKLKAAAGENDGSGGVGFGVALALLAAVTLDGVPENLALGVSLIGPGAGGSLALLVAIFASNFPESLVGSDAMRRAGRSKTFSVVVWSATALLLTAAVVVGYALLSGVDENILGFALAFAGGAVLSSLADTLMPEAFEHGRPLNSFATAAGFFLSFVLAG